MRIRTAFFVAMMTFTLSCARHCGERAYTRVVEEQTEVYAYSASTDAIWKETSAILAERAYEFGPDVKPTEAPVLSAWQGEPGNRTRYSVRIIPGTQARLEVHELSETEVPTYADVDVPDGGQRKQTGTKLERERERDFTVEWEVLRRLDPARASQIEQMAIERRAEVEDVVSRGCT